jgi:S1-C subfamily serine protease
VVRELRGAAVARTSKKPPPTEGERVVALGSPLDRLGALSIAIVNVADERAIVSDADVNYLSFGGPLLDLDGNIIGLKFPFYGSARCRDSTRGVSSG